MEAGTKRKRSAASPPPVTEEERRRFARFASALAEVGRKPLTVRAYRFDWVELARWWSERQNAPFDLARLLARDLVSWRDWALKRRNKATTINRRLVFVKKYARWAMALKEVDLHEGTAILAVPRLARQRLAPRVPPAELLRGVFRIVRERGNQRDLAILHTLYLTGIRISELVGLDRADADLSPGTAELRIRGPHVKGSKERTVPLPEPARKTIEEYLTGNARTTGPLFMSQRGPLSEVGVRAMLKASARRAGFAQAPISPHKFRHAYAYEYLAQNPDDLVGLADLLGHSSLETTRVYTRRRLEDLRKRVGRLRLPG